MSGEPDGMDNGEMALFVEWLERRERGMQAEEPVEIDDLILWNGDAGPHRVVVLLAIGNHDVQAVGGAALKDDDEAAIRAWLRSAPAPSEPESWESLWCLRRRERRCEERIADSTALKVLP